MRVATAHEDRWQVMMEAEQELKRDAARRTQAKGELE
jgi:hypothetical protein